MQTLSPIVGSVLAALIAGIVSFLVSVFTKESKTSEFRQAWIDALRNDMAEFISAYHYIANETAVAKEVGTELPGWFHSLKDELLKIEQMQARIELRLNPKEHAEIIRSMRDLVGFSNFDIDDFGSRKSAIESLISDTQKLLKAEWVRVKRGEVIYRTTKWISLMVVITSLILFIWVVVAQPG